MTARDGRARRMYVVVYLVLPPGFEWSPAGWRFQPCEEFKEEFSSSRAADKFRQLCEDAGHRTGKVTPKLTLTVAPPTPGRGARDGGAP